MKKKEWKAVLAAAGLAMTALGGCARRTVVLESRSEPVHLEESESGQRSDVPGSTQTDDVSGGQAGQSVSLTETESEISADTAPEPETEPVQSMMIVHVVGEVVRPGVYQLCEAARIYEAVEAAGGFTADADQTWCNQAQMLSDGDLLRIYSLGETEQMRQSGLSPREDQFGITHANGQVKVYDQEPTGNASDSGSAVQDYSVSSMDGPARDGLAGTDDGSGRINLNTATLQELMTLSGIGQTRAEDIIAYREQHGGFTSTAEVKQISGIGDATYNKIRDHICV